MTARIQSLAAAPTLAILVALAVLVAVPTQAQTLTVLHAFTGGGDGSQPYAGVNLIAGSLYGTTSYGGQGGYGTVYQLRHRGSGWILSTLYSFTGRGDGSAPLARVTAGPGGILYGTTWGGGYRGGNCSSGGCGTVFSLHEQPTVCLSALCPWVETVLYAFQGGSDGAETGWSDDLVFDQAGNIYGTTSGDSNGDDGTVWELSPSNGGWTETVLHRFTEGETPWSGVTFDNAGNLYGTTVAGGIGYGTVYELTPSGSGWNYQTLYEFQGRDDGFDPDGGVVFDAAGNLYGTTSNGSGNGGSVFEMRPSGSGWTLTTIYNDFPSPFGPLDTPTLDAAGNVYGTVVNQGYGNQGVVFKLTPSGGSWTETNLEIFGNGNDADTPYGSVVLDGEGNIYGTTLYGGGGDGDNGTVWEITP
ncbi:MAG: choice-of-anchor tandem repeat GloVer-containing protein [Candidatus Korobacteraceae bacterium]|jgi:uncharacterized repeat protein (TIGR03803 family)